MLAVSWTLRFCVVGTATDETGIAVRTVLTAVDAQDSAEIALFLEQKPKLHIAVLDVPRFVRAGLTMLQVGSRSYNIDLPPDLPHSWLTVTATRKLTIDDALEKSFYASPKTVAPQVSRMYGATVRNQLRPVAQLAAALSGLWLKGSVLLPWVEQERYWTSERDFQGFSVGAHGESLDATVLQQAQLLSHLPDLVVCFRQDHKGRRRLTRALAYHAEARTHVVGTGERVVGMVKCLEMLSGVAPVRSDPLYVEKATALREALAESPRELRDFAEELLRRPPTAVTRFGHLAGFLGCSSKDDDVILFHKLWQLRNTILHGAQESEALQGEHFSLALAADHLAARYLEETVARLRADLGVSPILIPAQ